MSEHEPVPQTAGSLVPPPRYPPTAVGAATPEPDPSRAPTPFIAARARTASIGRRLAGIALEADRSAIRARRRRIATRGTR